MKRLLFVWAIALNFSVAYGQRLDLHSFAQLRKHQFEQKSPASRGAGADESVVRGALITLNEGFTRADLEEAGVEVKACRGKIAVCFVELQRAEEVAALPCVKAMSLQRQLSTKMDVARAASQVDAVHFNPETLGLPKNYTGKDVIAGIVDQGLDAHHINFRYPDGSTRIEYLYWARLNSAGTSVVEDNFNYETLNQFSTDNANYYHATHTLGILAGGYDGPVKVGTPWADPTVPEAINLQEIERCPYYGVAPSARLCASVGDLQDAFVAYGVESLLNFRYWANRPMVLNMSLGSSQGPHDPNSQMAQYLNEAGKEAIICMSAGNEGDLKIALQKTFTEEDQTMKTFIYPYYYQYDPEVEGSGYFRNGSVEVWSADDTPFELKAVIYNKERNYRSAYNMPIAGENIGTYYTSTDFQITDDDVVGAPQFLKAYSMGYVGVGAKIDEQTGRYYGMVDYYVLDNSETNIDDNYVLGFEVVGKPGQTIYCYCDGLNTWMDNYGVEGFTDGSTDGTISDMAMAKNTIVVGSYNTRNTWNCLDGGTSRYEGDGFIVDHISGFSSYGTTLDGRSLPTVCGPGAAIISSISWPYARQMSEKDINYACSARLDEETRTNLWKQEVGTSMSTPFVAGGIALWLEANPDLTVADVQEIIAKTAIVDDAVKADDPKRWGAGKFNVVGGLKEAIRMYDAGLDNISADNDRLILTSEGPNVYTVFLGTARNLDVVLHSADGRRVLALHADGDELTADLSSLPAGVYIMTVNGKHSSKIAVK